MSVSKRARYEVLRRDGHRCRYCGRTTDDGARLTIDHVVPVSLGGVDDPGNLVAACMDCNAGKSSSPADAPLVATVSDDALRWAAAMARAGDAVLADITKHDAVLAEFDAEWTRWHRHGRQIARPADWQQSINAMLRTGIPIDALVRLVDIPMTNDALQDSARWRYFCGCAWRAIDKMRDLAAQELAAQEPAAPDPELDPDLWHVYSWMQPGLFGQFVESFDPFDDSCRSYRPRPLRAALRHATISAMVECGAARCMNGVGDIIFVFGSLHGQMLMTGSDGITTPMPDDVVTEARRFVDGYSRVVAA